MLIWYHVWDTPPLGVKVIESVMKFCPMLVPKLSGYWWKKFTLYSKYCSSVFIVLSLLISSWSGYNVKALTVVDPVEAIGELPSGLLTYLYRPKMPVPLGLVLL